MNRATWTVCLDAWIAGSVSGQLSHFLLSHTRLQTAFLLIHTLWPYIIVRWFWIFFKENQKPSDIMELGFSSAVNLFRCVSCECGETRSLSMCGLNSSWWLRLIKPSCTFFLWFIFSIFLWNPVRNWTCYIYYSVLNMKCWNTYLSD